MKKLARNFGSMILMLILVSIISCVSAFAGTTDDGRYNFTLNTKTGEVTINKYLGNDVNLVIPSRIHDYPVTEIDYCAFEKANSLRNVSFESGSSLKTLDWGAFSNCENLEYITLPSTLRTLGDAAFYYCTSLKSIVIPEGITAINHGISTGTRGGVFDGCSSLTSVSIPSSVTRIGLSAFRGCSALQSVTLPAGLKDIGYQAFQNSALTSIVIPAGITKINSGAFSDCTNLRTVLLPDTLKDLGSVAFKNCTALTSVNVPIYLTDIGSACFSGCTSLTSLTFGEDIKYPGDNLFKNCPNLTVRVVAGSKIEEHCINNNIKYYRYASSISSAEISGIEDKFYTGSPITQAISVTCRGDKLTQGIHYNVAYSFNTQVGKATMTITGTGNYVGMIEKTFQIKKADLSGAVINVSTPTLKYNAQLQTPAVTVTLHGVTIPDTEYSVYYSNNRYVGTATVRITGKNNYQNSADTTFTIIPKGCSVKKPKASASAIRVSWKKQDIQTSGYQVQLARNAKFTTGKKTKNITSSSTLSYTFKKLKRNTKYFVRVRTFRTVNGKKYYSAWCKAKSIKTKR